MMGHVWISLVLVGIWFICGSQSRSLVKIAQPDVDTYCGYESCPKVKSDVLNIHLIPHTHDDVGWLKTLDQYYYGSRSNIQQAGVQYILDTVVEELAKDPARRFIYVESAYFFKWWEEQPEEIRSLVQEFVNSGRLEMIGGAWSMNDEAATHYQSVIDQFAWGLRRINDTFGPCGRPRVAWQIDPFGHAREFASVLAGMGYDGLFHGRIDYQDLDNRKKNKQMEQIWEASPNLGSSHDLFTSVLIAGYYPPSGFCFDTLCGDTPIVDDESIPDYNVDSRITDFVNWAKDTAAKYRTNNIAVTMGGDFHYQNALSYFKNMDKLIKYLNLKEPTMNAIYSTPSCYLKAVNDVNLSWDTKQDDFFPYATDDNSYWTGYFTSRPTLKYFERLGNNFLQIAKQLFVQTNLKTETEEELTDLREAMGILQHHDAITGTEKQHVAEDYARILYAAINKTSGYVEKALNTLLATSSSNPSETWKSCLLSNQSVCGVSETADRFVVTLYNPLSRTVNKPTRLAVPDGVQFSVYDSTGKQIVADLVPLPDMLLKIKGRESNATLELVFLAENLPALGIRSYFVVRETGAGLTKTAAASSDDFISSQNTRVNFDTTSGAIKSAKFDETEIELSIDVNYYEGATNGRASGAYVFRSNSNESMPISTKISAQAYKGQLVEEIHRTINEWNSQVIRLYKNSSEVEVEWLVGPIPVADSIGKEIINIYTTDIASSGEFYTDSNGRELLKRKRDSRETWDLKLSEPVSGNYYPIVSQLGIRDTSKGIGLTVVTDRAEGGSSLKDGQIELMVHRRLLKDDGFGVGEALNEQAFGDGLVVRGKQWIIAGPLNQKDSVASQARLVTQERVLDSWAFLTPTSLSIAEWTKVHLVEKSALNADLPSNVQILTLEPWKDSSVLLRLEHILENEEDPDLSIPVTIDLSGVFSSLSINGVRETTLDGNLLLSDSTRLQWKKTKTTTNNKITKTSSPQADQLTVDLQPMEIRTFVVDLE